MTRLRRGCAGREPAKVTALEPRRGPRQSRIPARAATDLRLTKFDLRLLALLGRHSNAQGWCTRSQGKMAEELETHRRCVVRSIGRLKSFGYLAVEAQTDGRGARRSSRYRFLERSQGGVTNEGGVTHGVTPPPVTHGVTPPPVTPGVTPPVTPGVTPISLNDDSERQQQPVGQKAEKGNSPERRSLIESAAALHRRICERLQSDRYDDEVSIVLAWLEAGRDPELHIMPGIERVLKREHEQLPWSLAYFGGAIRDLAQKATRARGAVATAPAAEPEGPPEWLALRTRLRQAVGDDAFASWLARLEWRGVEQGRLKLAAPTRFHAQWVRRHYIDAIRRAARAELGADAVEVEHG